MNEIGVAKYHVDLVALKITDHMKGNLLCKNKVCKRLSLMPQLLRPIFSKETIPYPIGTGDCLGIYGLGDRHHTHIICTASMRLKCFINTRKKEISALAQHILYGCSSQTLYFII